MNEVLTKLISCPSFSTADKYILERIDKMKLTEWIAFLRSYRKVMWRDGDVGDLVPLEELRKRKVQIQPLPEYPQILKEMGAFFRDLLLERQEFILDLRKVGFFTKGSLASLWTGTLWSATLTANLIFDAYHRERFCDGLFGMGIDNGLYLKLLLHLEDLVILYQTIKSHMDNTEQNQTI